MMSLNFPATTITSMETLNIPGMHTSKHNASRIRRISEDDSRCAGEVCLDDTQNGLCDGHKN
jgi:hypothetical protein